MKRASYRNAVEWIALMDSAADNDALDPLTVSELVTVGLVADIFDVDPHKIGADIVRYRKREKK